MNFELTPEQQLLVETARDFVRRHQVGDPWPTIASAGWCGLPMPELVLVCEALGQGPVHSPLITTAVLAMPELADGTRIGTLAVLEAGMRDEWDGPQMTGGSRLSGTKLLVPWPHAAEVFVVATTDGLFAVEPSAGTTTVEVHDTLDADIVGSVVLDRAPAERLAELDLYEVLDRIAVAHLAFAIGAAQRALELSVQHATHRHQFGRPIGSFQAIAHRCAEMRADIDACRYLAYQAAWALERDDAGVDIAVAAAKSYANDALRRVFRNAHQAHGAIGFSTEHPLHRFTTIGKAFELSYGGTSRHRERVASAMGLGIRR